MNAVRWLDEREARAWRGLQFMQMQLDALLAQQLAEDAGLSYADYVVLVALTGEPCGRLRAKELGCRLGWEQSRVSHHVARMAARGYVERQSCPSDRRGAFVAVTPLGRATIEAAAPGHLEAVRRHFVDLLTPEQLDVLGDVTGAVLAHLASIATAAPDASAPAPP